MMRSLGVTCSLSAMFLATALAQAPTSEMDAHIATARVAAGQDYRATFVNLCLPAAPRGGGAGAAGASVLLSNHSEYDGAYTKARLIAAPRQPGENHPFIIGTGGVQRYFTVMTECALASKLRNGAK